MLKTFCLLTLAALAMVGQIACAQMPATLNIDVNKPGVAISPMLYGLMTEEINHSFDGGLYAELIQNRSFKDDPKSALHWSVVADGGSKATISLDSSVPVNPNLTVSLRIDASTARVGRRVGVANDGYWGIPLQPNTAYTASFFAKADGTSAPLVVSIEYIYGSKTFATAQTSALTGDWKKYMVTLSTRQLEASKNNRFVISTNTPGTIWLSFVSLFPPTFNDRPNGTRIDLMQKLADLHPAFLRMPGGNYLEGDTFPTRFNWKEMIGPVDQRPGHMGCWSYRSSDGFGMISFLDWCDDLHMKPLLAVFAGYTLNHDFVPAGTKLQPYVDEALEEIEYCTGEANTTWGKRRAQDGHPAPFKIRYLEVGNEDWFDRSGSYDGRFAQFYDAIKARYPQLQIIATTPVKSRRPDVIDDHFYRSATRMEFDGHHYDKTDRNGPKIFVGEWATVEGHPTPNLNAALADAAWLMGLERNSDVVIMSAYAPLLVNVNPNASQWGTNLIGYDALSSFGSPSYWAQVMFNQNRADVVLPAELKLTPSAASAEQPHGAVGVGSWHTSVEFKDLTVTNGNDKLFTADLTKDTTAWKTSGGKWSVHDNTLRQTSETVNCIAFTGDQDWSDYTVNLKARKISGDEGFWVLFRVHDADHYLMWNVGGWGNSHSSILENDVFDTSEVPGSSVPLTVETARWYDVKIEVQGYKIRTFLDGKLINQVTQKPVSVGPAVFASASYIKASNEVVVKLVNASAQPVDAAINLRGANVAGSGKAIILTSASPSDQNTIAQPLKISPHEEPVTDASASFKRNLPAHSFTLLRLQATPQ